MKVLLTGASSFTGYWFARELILAGHEVVAPLRNKIASYSEGIRSRRVALLKGHIQFIDECAFGDDAFLRLIESENFDILCHHAAHVGDYKNPEYDILFAVHQNTNNLKSVLEKMTSRSLKAFVLTGSVFESNEGAGEMPLRAFSPYGVSKSLTAEIAEFYCNQIGIPFGKFVIPNPFGPYEELRFCNYLMKSWLNNLEVNVATPNYVRDNVHVALLAKMYRDFLEKIYLHGQSAKLNPSGYVESQGAFTLRVASEVGSRLGIDCKVNLNFQKDYAEPLMRVNTVSANDYMNEWNDSDYWDSFVTYYKELYEGFNE